MAFVQIDASKYLKLAVGMCFLPTIPRTAIQLVMSR